MKYSYSTDEEIFHGDEDSIEDAIIESGIEVGESIFIGEQVPFVPHISCDTIIEQLECDACDVAGEHAEEWLRDVPKEERDELEKSMNEVLQKWIKDKGYTPRFYGIDNVKFYERKK